MSRELELIVREMRNEAESADPHHNVSPRSVQYWAERLAALTASPQAAPEGGLPRVQLTAPERIYLTVSDDFYDESQVFPDNHEDICWCQDEAVSVCVPYVRADIASPQVQGGEACHCPQHGEWLRADDVRRLTRELDVALNGEAGAAQRPSLCDVVAQVVEASRRLGPLLPVPATPQRAPGVSDEMVERAAMVLWGTDHDKRANQHLRFALEAALASGPSVEWQLVPKEPTLPMCISGDQAVSYTVDARAVWIAMLAAAPAAQDQGEGK